MPKDFANPCTFKLPKTFTPNFLYNEHCSMQTFVCLERRTPEGVLSFLIVFSYIEYSLTALSAIHDNAGKRHSVKKTGIIR